MSKIWLARDESGYLHIFGSKPHRRAFWGRGYKKDIWDCNSGQIELPKKLFQNVTWENDPIEVEVVPKTIVENFSIKDIDKALDNKWNEFQESLKNKKDEP